MVRRALIVPSNRRPGAPLDQLSFLLPEFPCWWESRVGKPDIIITESPPLFLALSGWLLAKSKGARFILNVSDLWPDSAKHIGMLEEGSPIYRVHAGLAHFCYRQAWLVTGQSREIIEAITRQVPEARTYHLSNGVDPENFSPKRRNATIRKCYLRRTGSWGLSMLDYMDYFKGWNSIVSLSEQMQGQKVRFLFFGDGPQKQELVKISGTRA